MTEHGDLLWEYKERKGMMEARKHLVQYLHGFPGVKEYRSSLVHVENIDDIKKIIEIIRTENRDKLKEKMSSSNSPSQMESWGCENATETRA